MKKAYIFISFTTSQNQNIKNCIYNLSTVEKSQSKIYLITNAPNIFDEIPEEHRIILKKISTVKDAINQLFFRYNSKRLKSFISSLGIFDKVEVCIPHFLNILCNHFYHFYISKIQSSQVKIALYPDGMLSYQPYEIYSCFHKDTLYRYIGGILSGMYYTPFIGLMADPFNCVEKIYTYIPNVTIPYQSKEMIKISFPEKKLMGQNIILLGHFKQNKLHQDHFSDIKNKVQNILLKHPETSIYYKPHPRTSNMKKDLFYQSLISDPKLDFDLNQDDIPIEALIEKIRASIIIAAVSTSMINLKLMYKQKISCYYFGLKEYIDSQYIPYYEKVFNHLSIQPISSLYV